MMETDLYKVVGVMSGTSLDGVDLVVCEFRRDTMGSWMYSLSNPETISYSKTWENRLGRAMACAPDEINELNRAYTAYLGKLISGYIRRHRVYSLDAVCSHGHTVFHQPEKELTLQIGNLSEIAKHVGVPVVCDFRVQDVKLGGQGAPLVPIGDRLLFGEYDYCLNLGGFANISFERLSKRVAYDICPVNVVLNSLSNKLGKPYDKDGEVAAVGSLDERLLTRLNSLPYYNKTPPKTLGLEWVNQYVRPIISSSEQDIPCLLRTYTEHIAQQLSRNLKGKGKLLVTGGGAYNRFLISRLNQLVDVDVIVPDSSLVEFKEALVFGLLGVLRIRDEVNCLASVTGASRNHSSGNVFLP